MKSNFIIPAFVLTIVLFSQAKAQHETDYENNPYWLIDHLNKSKIKYVASGQITIGKCVNTPMTNGVIIQHVYKTIQVTIPKGASIIKIHPFIFNIDGLKGPGGEPNLIPWGTRPDVDYRWGTFHSPKQTTNTNGEIVVSVEYDNWSDIESRAGYLIVEYSGGNSTTIPASSGSNCTNTVRFYNPKGTSRTVFLYIAKVKNNSTIDFCSNAQFNMEMRPGDASTVYFSSDEVLIYQSYDVKSCTYLNNIVSTGSLSNQCCSTLCEISINSQ